ncbi:MAG: hypothetical protein ACFE0J_18115 [Elainellaceae cyanobacterium]
MANTHPNPQSTPQWVDAQRIAESASESTTQSDSSQSDDPTHQSPLRTSRLNSIQILLAFVRQRPALVAIALWIVLLDIAFVATLVLITPQFAERQESLPSSLPKTPSSERVADQPSMSETRALPMLSLVSIVLGCSLGSLMIVQRVRPPRRLTRSPSRLTSKKSSNRLVSSSSSPKAEPSSSSETELSTDAADPSVARFPSTPVSRVRRRPVLPPKLESDAAELLDKSNDGTPVRLPEAISLDELDIRHRRSLSSWDESGLGADQL